MICFKNFWTALFCPLNRSETERQYLTHSRNIGLLSGLLMALWLEEYGDFGVSYDLISKVF